MATCKDCLYYDVCPLGLAVKGKTGTCLKFKNKADVVEVVRCKGCKHFAEYTEQHKATVEKADGDCFLRMVHCEDRQFWGVQYDDFCSYGKRK